MAKAAFALITKRTLLPLTGITIVSIAEMNTTVGVCRGFQNSVVVAVVDFCACLLMESDNHGND